MLTDLPTAQTAPSLRSIQRTMRSSAPSSSTPERTRSANRSDAGKCFIDRGYNRRVPLKNLSFLRNPFSFLFARSGAEDRLAGYVIREHGRGRSLTEILDD